MNKLQHQEKLYNTKWKGEQISELLEDEEFLSLCHGDGFNNWDDDYFCIIEQQLMEAKA